MKKTTITRVILGVLGLSLIVAGLVSGTEKAAANYDLTVCNSSLSHSKGTINASDQNNNDYRLYDGQCTVAPLYNLEDNARVYVFWTNSHSYKIKRAGGSYGPCHEINKPSPYYVAKTSNPPNNTDRVYYRMFRKHGCSN